MASSTAKGHLPVAAPAQQGLAVSSSSSTVVQVAEDESRKKSTDCVYFLASPLTCKKGSECEYRHSEYARVNPRDCWFWLHGKCLNPKCSYRHPPLDTSLGTPADSSAGSSMPASSSTVAGPLLPPSNTVPSAPYIAPKPTTPCIFFQKGYCLKGDRCPFVHGQNPASNKASEFPAANMSEPSRFNTASSGFQKCAQLKIPPQANVSKPIEAVPPQPKTSVHAVRAVPRNGAFTEKRLMPQHNVSNEDLHKHDETTLRSLNNGSSRNKPNVASQASSRDDQRFQSGKEADDMLRESSPGFDVLVDDELGDADYYGNDEQFPRIRGHEGRDLNEFEVGRPDRYKSLDDVDPVVFHDRHGYEKYKTMQERRGRESSERQLIEGSHYDRRSAYNKGVSTDGTRNPDLRQRLSKQRRTNGLTSVVNPDYHSDNLGEEHRYRSAPRDSRRSPPRGSSISSRLQGRIKLPGQPSLVSAQSIHSEREYEKGRSHSRLSPSRPQLQSHRGRLQDRLRGKVQDDIGRDVLLSRREVVDYSSSDFVAPKSLAELKRGKQSQSQSQGLLKNSEEFASVGKGKVLGSSQNSEDVLSFEPPKPLSEILKRKRKAEDTNSHSGMVPGAEEVGKSTKNKENAAVEKQAVNKEEENKPLPTEESEAHNVDFDDKTKPTETEIAEANNNVSESEEGLITDGVEESHELEEEYYEEGDGGYEDEQDGGEGYNLEEGENGELQEEYMDEDEEDNFAKKIGVMFS